MRSLCTVLTVSLLGACSFTPGGGPSGASGDGDARPGFDTARASDGADHDAEPPPPFDAPSPPDAGPPPPPDATVCPDGFAPGPVAVGGCYRYVADAKEWQNAQDDCAGRGAHLVTITSAAENTFVLSLLGGGGTVYFGINDRATEGTYVWVTGEPVVYTNFLDGEGTSGSEDCGEMNTTNGGWYDDQCDNDRPYVCER